MSAKPRITRRDLKTLSIMTEAAMDARDQHGSATHDDLRASGFTWAEITRFGSRALASAAAQRPIERPIQQPIQQAVA